MWRDGRGGVTRNELWREHIGDLRGLARMAWSDGAYREWLWWRRCAFAAWWRGPNHMKEMGDPT